MTEQIGGKKRTLVREEGKVFGPVLSTLGCAIEMMDSYKSWASMTTNDSIQGATIAEFDLDVVITLPCGHCKNPKLSMFAT